MKTILKYLLATLLFTSLSMPSFSQRQHAHEHLPGEFCKTMDVLEMQQQRNPQLQSNMLEIERFTQQAIKKSKSRSSVSGVINIPVVFHVIHNQEGTNISRGQILSQLNVLNEDFRNRNENRGNTPDVFRDLEADVEIEFSLANVDPNGYKTSGITRTPTYHNNFYVFAVGNDFMKFDQLGGRDAWPTDQYLNVWICQLADNGILGYAQFPGDNPATDGVVVDYRFFGTVGAVAFYPTFNGRTLTHEVGHWLNLRHIWGDGDCEVDDFVEDTPLQSGPNGGNAYPCTFPGRNSCDEGEGDLPDMFQNYMDYSNDECMSLFTKGQKARMRALFEPGGPRESLLHSKGYADGLDLVYARNPRCNDGIRNGTEEDIDCGGNCDPCPESPFCISAGDLPFYEWIESVSLTGNEMVTFENVSGLDFGYGPYQDLVAILKPGSEVEVSLIPGYESVVYNEYWKIFIDYNQDNDLEDEGELVFDSQYPDTGRVQGTFIVPEDAAGTTLMRVVMKYTDVDDPGAPNACGIYGYGETEDYTVSFQACDAPENVKGRLAGNDIVLSWDPVLSASAYKVRYYDGYWITKFVDGTNFTLINPGAGTFTFQVAAVCGGGSSPFSNTITIGTSGASPVGHLIGSTSQTLTNNLQIERVFPNPTSSLLSVAFAAEQNENVVISVRDILGRTLLTQEHSAIGRMETIQLAVNNFANGVYYLSLNNGSTIVTKKFVKE